MTKHVDDFALLRLAAGDLADDERRDIASHVTGCPSCGAAGVDILALDGYLRVVASSGTMGDDPTTFRPGDPFRRRPRAQSAHRRPGERSLAAAALFASDQGVVLQKEILEAVRRGANAVFFELALSDAADRFGLLYALQQAGREIAEDPVRARRFAQEVLRRLRAESSPPDQPPSATEQMVPLVVLRAQAHLLIGMACMWKRDYGRGQANLVAAYRCFARGGGDETSLAHVELVEAQRRAFVHEGAAGLVLARRAHATFEERGLEDMAARAIGAQGLAYSTLGREEEAVDCFRRALPVYERHELWSNFVGCLNSIATSLTSLGRVDEARREYARALKRFSHESHRHWLGYIRTGLAETLFGAGRYSQAAASSARAAQIFRDAGMRANAYIATLLEIESRARSGELDRARRRLELLQTEISRDTALDRAVFHEIADALSGGDPDLERVSALRLQAEDLVRRDSRERTA